MKFGISRQNAPILATLAVGVLLYTLAGLKYDGFFSLRVFVNFFSDNAFLGIAAVGLTFVILSGGIDLSVGAMVGCSSILIAVLIERAHMPPVAALALILVGGSLFGAGMGCLISVFRLPPFLVTLAGLFFLRGAGLMISTESIPINHPVYRTLSALSLPLLPGEGVGISLTTLIFLFVLLTGIFLSRFSRFGRNVYALGGSEQSAMLMGVPIARTMIGIYALSGFCSSLAGIVFTLYMSSGNATGGAGLELDAIAAVVVGGTLLSGGVGYVSGTLLGVLILGMIQTAIMFQGNLSSWWTRIAVGLLLLLFVLLQKLMQRKGVRS